MTTYSRGWKWRSDTRRLHCHSPEVYCTPPGASPQSNHHPSSCLHLHPPPHPHGQVYWTAVAWHYSSDSSRLHHLESPLFIHKIIHSFRSFSSCQLSVSLDEIYPLCLTYFDCVSQLTPLWLTCSCVPLFNCQTYLPNIYRNTLCTDTRNNSLLQVDIFQLQVWINSD